MISNIQITDFDQLQDLFRFPINPLKISKDIFSFHLKAYTLDNITLYDVESSSFMIYQGQFSQNHYTFSLRKDFKTLKTWKSKVVEENTMIIAHPKAELFAHSKTQAYSVEMKSDFLEGLLKELQLEDLLEYINENEFLIINKGLYTSILKVFKTFFFLLNTDPSSYPASLLRYKAQVEIPSLIINAILSSQPIIHTSIHTAFSEIAFSKALNLIQTQGYQQAALATISNKVEISERNLRNLFSSQLGIAPLEYIKAYKLTQVYLQLKQKDNSLSITDVANQFGFNHLGQFTKDYKLLWHELPSETIKIIL